MKNIILVCSIFTLVILSVRANDHQFKQVGRTVDGVTTSSRYAISNEKLLSLPTCDPMNGIVPLSVSDAVKIAFDTIPDKESYSRIVLSKACLNYVWVGEPDFCWYEIEFTRFKNRGGHQYSVIMLMDGSIVEPEIKQIK